MRIHYLQHVDFEDPGAIVSWARGRGHPVSRTLLFAGESLPRLAEFDWLLVMGGPMNVYDDGLFPWLAAERAFIRDAIGAGKTVVGICLGAQLIADAIGGRVVKNRHREIGWHPVFMTDAARVSPVLSFLPETPIVFQWHGDAFVSLPDGATILARGEACANQAFRYGERVFGFQFHLEYAREHIEALIRHCPEDLRPGTFVQDAESMLARPERVDRGNAWMRSFLTNLEPRYEEGFA